VKGTENIAVMTTPMITRSLVAIHEAGHAVVGAHLRIHFSHVSIKPGRKGPDGMESAGHVLFTGYRPLRGLHSFLKVHTRQYRFVHNRAVCNLAARAAVDLYKHCLPKHKRNSFALELDYQGDEIALKQHVEYAAEDFQITFESFHDFRTLALQHARRIVAVPFISSAIAAVANELDEGIAMNRWEMPYRRVRQILHQCRLEAPRAELVRFSRADHFELTAEMKSPRVV
jgi:hypothetical protein